MAQSQKPKNDDLGASQVQDAFDKAEDKGYFGYSPDPTPPENYTLPGVVAGKPTPETDEAAAQAVVDAARDR